MKSDYEDLCQTYFAAEGRWLTIDRILRELPWKMRQAISDCLAAPQGFTNLPFARATRYVDLYERRANERGIQDLLACEHDEALKMDSDGDYVFTVGVCVENARGALLPSLMRFTLRVERFSEQSVELQIKFLDGTILISDVNSDASYREAAKEIVGKVMGHLRDSKVANGSREPIGFVNSSS